MENQPPAKRKQLRSQVKEFTLEGENGAPAEQKQEKPVDAAQGGSQPKPEGEKKKLGLSNTSSSFTAPTSAPVQNMHPALQQAAASAFGQPMFVMNPMLMNPMMVNPMMMQQYGMMPQHVNVPEPQQQFPFSEEDFQENPVEMLKKMGLTQEDVLQQMQQEEEDQEFNEMIEDIELFNKDEFDPHFKDCTCCKGFIYNCRSKVCENLGVCQCKAHSEMEEDAKERFITECKDCSCCKGFVYTCLGERCKGRPTCYCFSDDD